MLYSDFTSEKVQEDFGLKFIEGQDLFSHIEGIELGRNLVDNLEFKVPLALSINTEKGRSEFIIAEILIEVKRILYDKNYWDSLKNG